MSFYIVFSNKLIKCKLQVVAYPANNIIISSETTLPMIYVLTNDFTMSEFKFRHKENVVTFRKISGTFGQVGLGKPRHTIYLVGFNK